jgi:hypothetical protein
MNSDDDSKRKFANHRDWRDYVSAVQCSVAYPAIIGALRSGAARETFGMRVHVAMSLAQKSHQRKA